MTDDHFFDSYRTGILDIDEDHYILYRLLTEAVELINDGKYDVAFLTLETLHDQFTYHCAIEEALMKKIGYPYLPQHIEEHNVLKGVMVSIVGMMLTNENGPSPDVSKVLVDTLPRVFLCHIKQYDLQIAKFIVSNVT